MVDCPRCRGVGKHKENLADRKKSEIWTFLLSTNEMVAAGFQADYARQPSSFTDGLSKLQPKWYDVVVNDDQHHVVDIAHQDSDKSKHLINN